MPRRMTSGLETDRTILTASEAPNGAIQEIQISKLIVRAYL